MASEISSGGLGAIFSTIKHAHEKSGLLRAAKALQFMNSEQGFDCPGCAWPEPKDRSRFEFCENGAKTLMNATTTKVVDAKFFASNSVEELLSWSDYQLSNCGRLTAPAIRYPHASHFETIDYESAYRLVADKLRALKDPHRVAFYTSGRASNEAAFLYQLFARLLGTNNLCDCSNLCHESSSVALKRSIGIGKGTVQIEDFLEAEVIFLIGHNPSTNHPRMLSTLRDARAKGAKIVVINPLVEPGLKKFRHPQHLSDMLYKAKQLATHYFQIHVGGDHALFNAIAHLLIHDEKFGDQTLNQQFIEEHTTGFSQLKKSLTQISLKKLSKDCGLAISDIYEIARIVADASRVIYAWGMGITQTTYGVNTIEAITNLALLRGHLAKSGAGLCPVRGHSNVQGNRTMGITEKPSAIFLDRLASKFGFSPPRNGGFDVVDSIHAMKNGQIDIFMALGGNFLSAGPDTQETTQALERCDLAINISTSLNRTHLSAGQIGLIIPCLTRVEKDVQKEREQFVTVENSMGIVHKSRGNFAPINSDLPSEVTIISQIALLTLGSKAGVDWQMLNDNYDLIRDVIAECIPELANFNQRIHSKNGFLIDNPARRGCFLTATNKAQFAMPILRKKMSIKADLLLTTIRSHDQFNTSIYGLNDRYRGINQERRVIFMHQDDILRFGFVDGERIDLISRFNHKERVAENFMVKSFAIMPGSAATYFPEANVLVPLDSVAVESNTPTSKLIPIWVRRTKRSDR